MNTDTVPAIQEVLFGSTGQRVTRVGLGGEGALRTRSRDEEAVEVIEQALAQGIGYFDCAPAYADSERYYGLAWHKHAHARKKIFQASKSGGRTAARARKDLENTLRTMGTDHLDLWQIHDVRTEKDFRQISGPGGALEAFVEAKQSGKTRFIGVTGHHDPNILTRAVKEWPVDSVQLPVNPVESVLGGFIDETVAAAKEKGIAVIGMKVLGASHYLAPERGMTPGLLIQFALSQPVTLVIVGCSDPEEVRTLADAARNAQPMGDAEQRHIRDFYTPHAPRLAYYRGQ